MYFSLPINDIATCQEPIKLHGHGPPIGLLIVSHENLSYHSPLSLKNGWWPPSFSIYFNGSSSLFIGITWHLWGVPWFFPVALSATSPALSTGQMLIAERGWIPDISRCFQMLQDAWAASIHVTDFQRIPWCPQFCWQSMVSESSLAVKQIFGVCIYHRIKCLQWGAAGPEAAQRSGLIALQWCLKLTLTSHSMKAYVEGSFLVAVSYRMDQQRGFKHSTLQGMKPLH